MWSYFGWIDGPWPLILLAYIGTALIPAAAAALYAPDIGGKIHDLLERAEVDAYDSEGEPR